MSERSDKIGKPHPFNRSMDIAEVLKLADELLFTHTGDRIHTPHFLFSGEKMNSDEVRSPYQQIR